MKRIGVRRDATDVIDVDFRMVVADTCLSRADKHVVGALFVLLPAVFLMGGMLDMVSIYMLPIVMTVILAVFTFSFRRRINPQVRSWVTLACVMSIGFWGFFFFGSHVVAVGIGLLMGPAYFSYCQRENKRNQ